MSLFSGFQKFAYMYSFFWRGGGPKTRKVPKKASVTVFIFNFLFTTFLASNIPLPSTYIPIRAQPSPNQQSRQSTVIWPANAGPAWKSIDHHRSRVNPSPVFRYGKQVPKWLYDYDAYAEAQKHKEIKQRRRKVFAIIVVFLLFALVVAAGVVLAAVN